MAHIPRLAWPTALDTGQTVEISGERAHHLLRVLRRSTGDELRLFSAPDQEYVCRIRDCDKHSLRVTVETAQTVLRESAMQTLLVQGVSRGDRMEFSLQKAVELGVTAIQPVLTVRGGVHLDERRMEKKQAHWQAVVLSAAEQSGRTCVPEIHPCLVLPAWLAQGPHDGFVLDPLADHGLGGGAPPHRIALLIGPEGGLDEAEVRAARQAGLKPLRIGPRVLRTETAGIAALAMLQTLWGDLNR